MSFVITVYVPEAIVMASDSRQFVNAEGQMPSGERVKVETVASDFAYKTVLLKAQRVGISTYGQDFLGGVSTASHVRRLAEEHLEPEDNVESVATKLIAALKEQFPTADTAFHVAGFRKEDARSVPHVFFCHVATGQVERKNVDPQTGDIRYGARWGGQKDIISRLVNATHVRGDDGKPQRVQPVPIVWPALNVQDAIDYAIYAVRTTIDTMRFEARPKNVGGPIDVLVLTPEKPFWAQRKKLLGEPEE